MQDVIEKSKIFVLEQYSTYTGKFGPEFMKLFTEKSIVLVEELSKNRSLNTSAMLIGSYFHDVGRTVTDGKEHGVESKKIAEEFLAQNNVTDEMVLNIVFDCALNHGSAAHPTTPEGKLVQFVDKAVLLDVELMKIYFGLAGKEKTLLKLQKWYDFVGSDYKDKYEECVAYVGGR